MEGTGLSRQRRLRSLFLKREREEGACEDEDSEQKHRFKKQNGGCRQLPSSLRLELDAARNQSSRVGLMCLAGRTVTCMREPFVYLPICKSSFPKRRFS